MFDFSDDEEEAKRALWYAPIGEFVVLFSNIEFVTTEWVRLLTDSNVIYDHVINIWSFRKRAELIVKLIDEYDIGSDRKEKWKKLWKKAIELSEVRNVIAHNPPFENFKLEFDDVKLKIKVSQKVTELAKLMKPIGDPGSGLSFDHIEKACADIRKLLIEFDSEHTAEISKHI